MTCQDCQGRDHLLHYTYYNPMQQLSTDTTDASMVLITVHLYHVNSQFVQVLQRAWLLNHSIIQARNLNPVLRMGITFQFVTFTMKKSGTHQAEVFSLVKVFPVYEVIALLFKLLHHCFCLSLI